MYSIKNVVERFGNARHEYGAVRFLMSSMRHDSRELFIAVSAPAFAVVAISVTFSAMMRTANRL